jgi:transcriptional regulator with XRE-family HTH domain
MPINFRGLQDRLREQLLAHINAGELTGLQLARTTGFQQAHISNFLNRKRGLSLEAMDAILQATNISLPDLIADSSKLSRRVQSTAAECRDFLSIPILEEQDCTATQVPKHPTRETIKIASSLVQRLHPSMHIPRPHWQRFIAIRVKLADVAAMAPRLTRGNIAVIDRHQNLPANRKSSSSDMFLVSSSAGFQVRYVEISGSSVLLRPHQTEFPCEVLPSRSGHDPLSAIIGRLCLLQVQL